MGFWNQKMYPLAFSALIFQIKLSLVTANAPLLKKLRVHSILVLGFLFFTFLSVGYIKGQTTNISGIINIYAPVTVVGCNWVTLSSNPGFLVGDRVLLIQMKGAQADVTNTSAFGSIISYADCGNYEFANVSAVTGNTVYFQFILGQTYSPANGVVQLVRVPRYTNAIVTSMLTAAAWNGSVGGVLAFEVSGTLTLNSNIDVSGLGFRGGTQCFNPDGGCGAGYSNYFYDISSGFGAEKGEGLSVIPGTQDGGRGAWTNGGGGGNKHNTGGAGGGNFSAGGRGGNQASFCPVTPTGGIGGYSLNYNTGKIFLGGGGGCSDFNNGVGTRGSNGGGLIIISANTILGNGNSILANGLDVPFINNGIGDGAGGAGAGGTILLNVPNFSGNITLQCNGGDGGDQTTTYGSCFGPGGGGGVGVAYSSLAAFPPNVTVQTLAGDAGVDLYAASPCFNQSFGATPGVSWVGVMNNLVLHESSTPNPSFSLGNDTILCVGPLILNPGSTGASYLWSTGATTQTLAVSNSGLYWVQVNMGGCLSVDTISVTFQQPAISIGNDTTLCNGAGLTLFSGGLGLGYLWSTGSSASTITVTVAGTYWVQVTFSGGCIARDTISILTGNPTVNIGNDTSYCNGPGIILDAGPGYSYLWNTGAITQTLSSNTSGTYSVTVTDPLGCQARDTMNLLVYTTVPVNLGPDRVLCAGTTITFTANPGMQSYLWQDASTFSYFVAGNTGLYHVNVMDINGCTGSDSVNITAIVPNPAISLGNDTTVCPTPAITLSPGNGFVSYLWQNGNNAASIQATIPGLYFVTVTDNNGCRGTDSIRVNFLPAPIFNIGNDTSFCQGGQVTFDAGPGFSSYLWQNGTSAQTFIAGAVGLYSVTVTGANGCASSDTAIVNTIFPLPIVNLGPDTFICPGTSIAISPGSFFASYFWQDATTANQLSVSQPGTYWVQVVDVNGCQGADSFSILGFLPPPAVQLRADTTICQGEIVILDAGPGMSSYQWSNGNSGQILSVSNAGAYTVTVSNSCGSISDDFFLSVNAHIPVNLDAEASICGNTIYVIAPFGYQSYLWTGGETGETLTVTRPGTYNLTVTDECGTSSDKIEVLESCNPHIYIPNAFSPNGDGLNDWFFSSGDKLSQYSLKVFDRWGMLIFESTEQGPGWNGQFRSADVQEGQYIWTLGYQITENGTPIIKVLKGSLTLIR